jgi:hypothetical protein
MTSSTADIVINGFDLWLRAGGCETVVWAMENFIIQFEDMSSKHALNLITETEE